ncbi:hypothetical protein NQ318_005534 [Aromia moschata]|uniref:HTH CENPB-type domain-containing protein n=1 Tax=Aromia moschata TaxID=1265417 RepID=A0AAV8XIL9_9CUCU|nr:hypothetical protein NQ318_005534 [Aromia moschata]
MAKAFDTVEHNELLKALENLYAMSVLVMQYKEKNEQSQIQHAYNTRYKTEAIFVPRAEKTKIQKSFTYLGPQLYNELPILFVMAKRVRKTDEEIQDAVEAVINQNLSIRSVAKDTGISKSLLADLVKKTQKTLQKTREELLVSYLRTTSKMCHGLTTMQTRELAYQFAVANKIVTPPEWNKNNKAGIHWLHGFMNRHKELSLRQPESTSLSRTSSFNKRILQHSFQIWKNYTRNTILPLT